MVKNSKFSRQPVAEQLFVGHTEMMRQLTGLDTSFLSLETPSQCGHVASLTIYDLAGWAERGTIGDASGAVGSFFDAIAGTVRERLHLIPLMRRKLIEVPLGLDHPYWINDPDFDLEFHVRNLALPIPGSDEQLAEQVARIISRPLDRARPLWELYVIDGLAGNRAAMLTKIHHAAIDGMAGVELLTTLLDTDPAGRIVAPSSSWKPEQPPSLAELAIRTAMNYAKNPGRALRLQAKALRSATGVARSAGAGLVTTLPLAMAFQEVPALGNLSRRLLGKSESMESFPTLPSRSAPKTPFNRSITPHRRFAYGSLSLNDAKTVRRVFGVTVNDVVLALSASALRRYLCDTGDLPVEPLVAMIPVSIRSGTEADAYTNRVSAVLTSLHTNLDDPQARLAAIHDSTSAAKDMKKAIPADLLTDLAQFAPPALAARASRVVTRTGMMNRINPPFNLIISNVPGPKETLYTSGAPLLHFYPVSTIVEGQGMNITVQSYGDTLDFGVVSCRELVPNPSVIITYLREALVEYVELAARATEAATEASSPIGAEVVPIAKAQRGRAKTARSGTRAKKRTSAK